MLEFYNLLSLEMDSTVKYYCPQPITAKVEDDSGKTREVTFDVYVVYITGAEEMQEVKYDSDLQRADERGDKTREQIHFEEIWTKRNQLNFKVRTDKEIMYNRFVIPNLLYLYAFVKRYHDPDYDELSEKVTYCLKDGRKHKIISVSEYAEIAYNRCLSLLAYMHFDGSIKIELTKKAIDKNTMVIINGM